MEFGRGSSAGEKVAVVVHSFSIRKVIVWDRGHPGSKGGKVFVIADRIRKIVDVGSVVTSLLILILCHVDSKVSLPSSLFFSLECTQYKQI